jgi:hypothetical protein
MIIFQDELAQIKVYCSVLNKSSCKVTAKSGLGVLSMCSFSCREMHALQGGRYDGANLRKEELELMGDDRSTHDLLSVSHVVCLPAVA